MKPWDSFGRLSGVVRGNHRSLSYGGNAMLQLRPLDPDVPISEQLGSDVSPVVLHNLFEVAEADIPAC
jgi:hypothetical protein